LLALKPLLQMKLAPNINFVSSVVRRFMSRPEGLVLFIFGLIQLVGITDPPLEIAHSWRQAFTAMVTRNYVELGMDWLHPRIDMAGEKTGIVGAEFPLFNFLSFLVSKLFGYQHWHGRIVNLVVVMWVPTVFIVC